jgi:manganese efflux pump family protein
MDLVTIFLLAVVLGLDAFAVALTAGATLAPLHKRQVFRLSFHFGLFQFLMPVLGWLAGEQVASVVGMVDHWIALVLLAAIGGRMIRGSFAKEEQRAQTDMTRGVSLVSLSVATSIDAFAVGLSLAVLDISVWFPCAIIGVVAAAMTLIGMSLGRRWSARVGKRMELVGGIILIAIGIRILIEHLG